jgi:peptidoglycan/LPS O-acetylase OafA/YrhL
LGIKSALNIMNGSMAEYEKAAGTAFIACLLVTAAAGEALYWLIDIPSQKFARLVFAWIRE